MNCVTARSRVRRPSFHETVTVSLRMLASSIGFKLG